MNLIKELYEKKIVSNLFISWLDDMKICVRDEDFEIASRYHSRITAFIWCLFENDKISYTEFSQIKYFVDEIFMEGF